jgi:Glycosyl hydrolase 2 galactose-binding domain-like/Exo-beta-D-glucosaminidase Ig-fold domain/Glycosyl hydrolases family 2/Concanavalin A-like lectin/glucanases superfamily/Glycosyl hydrolases family 2, TIM barrel domain
MLSIARPAEKMGIMKRSELSMCRFAAVVVFIACLITVGDSQIIPTNDPPVYGPYNAAILQGGDGVHKKMVEKDTVLRADSPWTMYGWVNPDAAVTTPELLAGVGDVASEYSRYLGLEPGKLMLWMGGDNSLSAPATIAPGKWQLVAATFDGTVFRLYSEGVQVGQGSLTLGRVAPVLQIAPPVPLPAPVPMALPTFSGRHFGGKIAGFTVTRNALSGEQIKHLAGAPPEFALVEFEDGAKPWPVQTRGQAGYRAPQDPATWPKSRAPFSTPVAKPLPAGSAALQADGDNQWTLASGWQMEAAPRVKASAQEIAKAGFDAKEWMVATVPGTALTTMIDRGIYPDSDYGLNNLAIPESLNKQDYWYRNEFKAPKETAGRRLTLRFEGINYAAEVWLNGQSLGNIKGAFIRGVFDVTDAIKQGQSNVLAVRVSPPPHPGIPQEQSILGGPGENGGLMCLDGPTFVATEGWDWIPAIRDRDTGIWQPVTLTATGVVKIGDVQVVTKLPLPDTTRADIEINVPMENVSDKPVKGTLHASMENVNVAKEITVPPGKSSVTLAPAEFAQLTLQNPRLWWPNGYGKPELYQLKVDFADGGKESDAKQVRFGVREVTYELGLLDSKGQLRRVEVSPTEARARGEQVVDVTREGMRQIPAADPIPPDFPKEWRDYWTSWAASLTPAGETSPAVRPASDPEMRHYLVIKVNGVRIAARGGNWGMDDSRKRVSREKLEPYFRLHREANVNIIRNWVGQNTEATFYDLADEYGMMVWNDFWASTEDYNIEPLDIPLFLDNARDTIERFRNHPSIVMWCGRNEGVPSPILNEGLIDVISKYDGTRYYSPSSNQVNLQQSGPYKFQPAALYYTVLNHGFSVETGAPSLSTLESLSHWMAKPDLWPISDAWAYHDWHQSGNGESEPFMAELEEEFGAGTSVEDFERKAQMLNYTEHRAIFEGMNAHLWAPNSGRMLWMTQPAWPSNMWQILSSDYDTQASFYGVKKACEPLHVQLDLSDGTVAVVNTTTTAQAGLTVTASVYSLDNKSLLHHEEKKDAAANAATVGFKLDLMPLMATDVILVKLELRNAAGQLLSDNLYWLGARSASYRHLTRLPAATLLTSATMAGSGKIRVQLRNAGAAAALSNKLTLVNASDGSRILPAYYSDNYVSLLPGETREVEIEYPVSAAKGAPQVKLRGWSLAPTVVPLAEKK